jgi:hypothetical protein
MPSEPLHETARLNRRKRLVIGKVNLADDRTIVIPVALKEGERMHPTTRRL